MSREALSKVDAAWLHMEDPTNLMMINGFFQFTGKLDEARVKATIEHRLLRFRRFRQRVVDSWVPMRSPYWETDPNFNLDTHIHRVALPGAGDDDSLKAMVNDLVSTPLDFSKPPWQFHLIENYRGNSILFSRLHHCIADGIALMHVLLSLCDEDADAPWPTAEPVKKRRGGLGLRTLMAPAFNAINTTRKITESMLEEGMAILSRPAHALELTGYATGFARSLARLLLLPPDPKTAFKGKLGVAKHAAWSEPLPVDEVKALGKGMGGTINDVLLTTMTGALRRYLLRRGENIDGLEIRAMVPVNLRPHEEAFKLGNQFGLVVLGLPIGQPEPMDRLLTLKRHMDDLKDTPEAVVGYTILNAMGLAPTEVETLGVEFFASKTTAVMTNVPGPRNKLYFAGSPIDKVMFWVPQSGRMGMGVSILSYAGGVVVGLITDAGLVPDPETIIKDFHEEFEDLKAVARQVQAATYKGPVQVSDEEQRGRCKALTRSGEPCKNRTVAGSAFCHVHAKAVADSDDMRRMA